MRYRRGSHEVDALLFDGSPDSAATILSRVPGTAAHGEMIEVATNAGRIFIGAGFWLTRDLGTRALHVIDDRDFARTHEPIGLV